jgi:hypothetical protein
MGVYSGVLAPPSVGFWFVVIVGALLTFGPICLALFREANEEPDYGNGKKKKKNSGKMQAISVGLFSAVTTLLLIHLFGDQKVLGWVYETPDRSSHEGLQALIVPFGPVFWVLVIAEAVVAFAALRTRKGGWATVSLFLTLCMVQFVTGVPVFPWIFHHYAAAGVILGVWVVIGVVWSFFYKWDSLVARHRRYYDEIRGEWLKANGFTEQSDFSLEDKANWEAYFEAHKEHEDGEVIEARPKYRHHKSELLGWATLWPVSIFETFMYDWTAQIFIRLYKRLGAVLQYIMERRWAGTEGHMLTEEERAILEAERKKKAVQPGDGPPLRRQ